MALNEKQKAFCEYYVTNFNATESAKRAGYSEKTARSIGQRLLTNVDIKSYIQTLIKPSKSSRIATIEEVYEYLTETMRNTEETRRERTKAGQLLLEALSKANGDGESGKELKIVIERKVVDLSKNGSIKTSDKL